MLIEDTLGTILTHVIRRWPHLPVEELRQLELQVRAQLGGSCVYVGKGRDTSKGDAYREARRAGAGIAEAAKIAGITRRHAQRIERARREGASPLEAETRPRRGG